MADDKTLSHLLQIEAEASDLVNDAQAKADRRVEEAERQSHAAYEERYRAEAQRLEAEYQQAKEQAKIQYRQELEAYRKKISSLPVNMERFSTLLNALIAGES